MLNICTVNVGNYQGRGADYVNTLFDMIGRNLSPTIEKLFVCLTDDPTGLDPQIEVKDVGLRGWWAKLAIFRMFENGERVLYFDLDSVITGSVDDLCRFSGRFAILKEFGGVDRWNSSVMAFDAGAMREIWERWDEHNRPQVPGGDQAWIKEACEALKIRPAFWQNILPGRVASYKYDLHRMQAPRGVSVVCFHGTPKPHECDDAWVKGIWRIGGWAATEIELHCNTADERLHDNIRKNTKSGLPFITEVPAHDGELVICGGAPSLGHSLPLIRALRDSGAPHVDVWGLNGAGNFMLANCLTPHAIVVMDARPENIVFVEGKRPEVTQYFLATQVDPSLVSEIQASGKDAHLWHAFMPGLREACPEDTASKILLSGGTSVMTRAMTLGYALGFRTFHMIGCDSCYEGDRHHAYAQPLNAKDEAIEVIADGERFMAAPWMVAQVNEFQDVSALLANEGCRITVYGDNTLLGWVSRKMMAVAA